MHSRAYMLLEKEWFKLRREDLPWGIQARPLNEDDMFIWEGTIKGPKDTMWEVDSITGQVCADFLDDLSCWKEFYSISYMLLSLQMMLPNPVIENAINPSAARIFGSSPSGFRQTVLDCVLASKRVEAGLKPHMAEDIDLTRLSPKQQELPDRTSDEKRKSLQTGKVSFDDYHAMWSGIATTKPVSDACNPLSEVLKTDSKLQATHFGLPQQELQEEIHKQLTEHNALMYGKFDTGRARQDLADIKSTKIQLLKQIYLPKQQGLSSDSPTPRTFPNAPSPSPTTARELDPHDQEVDELLAWTNALP